MCLCINKEQQRNKYLLFSSQAVYLCFPLFLLSVGISEQDLDVSILKQISTKFLSIPKERNPHAQLMKSTTQTRSTIIEKGNPHKEDSTPQPGIKPATLVHGNDTLTNRATRPGQNSSKSNEENGYACLLHQLPVISLLVVASSSL